MLISRSYVTFSNAGWEITNISAFHSHGLLNALMMEAERGSETSVNICQTTRCKNPEDSHLENASQPMKWFKDQGLIVLTSSVTHDSQTICQCDKICGKKNVVK